MSEMTLLSGVKNTNANAIAVLIDVSVGIDNGIKRRTDD